MLIYLSFGPPELEMVLRGLRELPYKDSARLIECIAAVAREQAAAAEKAARPTRRRKPVAPA